MSVNSDINGNKLSRYEKMDITGMLQRSVGKSKKSHLKKENR